jgi:transcriptional regulator with XRE-family HTH domain
MRRVINPKPGAKFQPRPDPIGQQIKELRVARGLTLQELADKVGVAPSHVFHVENGDKVPSEELAVKLAHALGDDEDLYRAWSRARSRSDFYTAVESAGVLAQYLRAAEQTSVEEERLRPEPTMGRWERPEVLAAARQIRSSALHMRLESELATPRPARLLVPMIAAGEDPGQGPTPSGVVDVLRLGPRELDPAEPLERPFAYSLTGASTNRVEGLLPDRGVAIFTRRVLPVVPHEIYAVRHEGRIVLSRTMWNGRELLLLPAPGGSDFIVLPAASEADVATLIIGRVAVLRAEP